MDVQKWCRRGGPRIPGMAAGRAGNAVAWLAGLTVAGWLAGSGSVALAAQGPANTQHRQTPYVCGAIDAGSWLAGVAATSGPDAWAVGAKDFSPGTGASRALIEHWDGSVWHEVASPSPAGATSAYLLGVAAVSARDAWAVGSDSKGTLVEHWNGSAWTVSPSPAEPGGLLTSVAAISASNVWAVGMAGPSAHGRAVAEHWDGRSWARVPTPGSASGPYLSGVWASRAGTWSVGYRIPVHGGRDSTWTQRWNGSTWTSVPSPNPGSGPFGDSLAGVSAASATSAWAVGHDGHSSGGVDHDVPLMERWDGTAWTVVHPQGSPTAGDLSAVTAAAPGEHWAVGSSCLRSGHLRTLVERGTGTSWAALTSPTPAGSPAAALDGVTATSPGNAWAVGAYQAGGGADRPLIERWNGTSWELVPSP